MKNEIHKILFCWIAVLMFCVIPAGCSVGVDATSSTDYVFDLSEVPEFSDEPYVVLNGNEPMFTAEDYVEEPFELYSSLDGAGRCGTAYANICRELMPTKKRGDIGSVKPSGWQTVEYDFVDGKYLYNRCHLIGFQLAGENANEKNLITGTRYMNVEGMLPFENMVADYVKETENHVLYRVTPIFEGENLVASGVEMEAASVEDEGEGICFHVYVYNNQPGVEIDYTTGESTLAEEVGQKPAGETKYITNENTKKFHLPDCAGVQDMKEANKKEYTGGREELIEAGYEACKNCKP